MEFGRVVRGTRSWGRKLLSGNKNSVHVLWKTQGVRWCGRTDGPVVRNGKLRSSLSSMCFWGLICKYGTDWYLVPSSGYSSECSGMMCKALGTGGARIKHVFSPVSPLSS